MLPWALAASLLWALILLLPWRPWATRERLTLAPDGATARLDDTLALIPARDEAHHLPVTLAALAAQGEGLRVVLVDDQSRDATAEVAAAAGLSDLVVVHGRPLASGWSGKVWAQHQGEAWLNRPYTLLLDADVELAPGTVSALRGMLDRRGAALASVLAAPHLASRWEYLLMPAFVFFFKLLYPFALANDPRSRVAAAAGGCVLLRTDALRRAGGFKALRDALIDDCTLAGLVKSQGFRIWIGLSLAARSRRSYPRLGAIWRMVARTAFTQLRYSLAWLLLCMALMVVAFVIPPAALLVGGDLARVLGLSALLLALAAYLPTLRYYRVAAPWVLGLPIAGALFLAMTWGSAIGYWRGRRSAWRGRDYATQSSP